ncbi:Acid phosphatase [Lecanosticta acicola]|uniref:Acid phosphatase n=1 Tax=Lecanosticta acicola TaxID=111012 RepID=A0AAI9EFP8_9PEZI|nr:Acid phosphatase [Lecanosticta acicola]
MFASSLLLTLLPLAAQVQGAHVVISNDDGWAEINIREFYNSLDAAAFDAIISAPADNESGTGSRDKEPTPVADDGCEFGSCPAGSPPFGNNASMPRFNYVNSYPVTSMRYGLQNLSQIYFGGPPDIAVAGPNVGTNLGLVTTISGTVGAATEAAKEGFPALAFSGSSGSQTAWTAPVESYMRIYADLSTNVTQTIVDAGKPYLPQGIWLNVNYPAVDDACSEAGDFKFVLSRVYPAIPVVTKDVETCGSDQLPTERDVVGTDGCYASVSVANTSKLDVDAATQAVVLKKLQPILSCLPEK